MGAQAFRGDGHACQVLFIAVRLLTAAMADQVKTTAGSWSQSQQSMKTAALCLALLLPALPALAVDQFKLQILNVGPRPTEVFYIRPDGQSVSDEEIESAKDPIIGTTIGRHFARARGAGGSTTEPFCSCAEEKQINEVGQAGGKKANGAIERELRDVLGWKVHVNKVLLESQREETEHALLLLKKMLDEIIRVVPAPAVAELQKVPLYFSPPYPGKRGGAEFHPDAGWLRENGRDPVMAKGVEFSGIADFEQEMKRMPNFALHELAHAYHYRVVRGGFDNAAIKAAYEHAKASGKYDKVERWHGNGAPNTFERAYAMTNPMEYFAENTEAFFSRNDFFPFTRDELKQTDPEMFELLERLWNDPTK